MNNPYNAARTMSRKRERAYRNINVGLIVLVDVLLLVTGAVLGIPNVHIASELGHIGGIQCATE